MTGLRTLEVVGRMRVWMGWGKYRPKCFKAISLQSAFKKNLFVPGKKLTITAIQTLCRRVFSLWKKKTFEICNQTPFKQSTQRKSKHDFFSVYVEHTKMYDSRYFLHLFLFTHLDHVTKKLSNEKHWKLSIADLKLLLSL